MQTWQVESRFPGMRVARKRSGIVRIQRRDRIPLDLAEQCFLGEKCVKLGLKKLEAFGRV